MQTVTSAIKHYFRVMAEPLLVNALYLEFMDAVQLLPETLRAPALCQVTAKLPPANLSLLTRFLQHLIRVAAHAEANKMKASNLGVVFGPTLIRAPEELAARALTDFALCNLLVELFIGEYDAIFGPDADGGSDGAADVVYSEPATPLAPAPTLTLVDGDEMYAALAAASPPRHSYQEPLRPDDAVVYSAPLPAPHPYNSPAPRSPGEVSQLWLSGTLEFDFQGIVVLFQPIRLESSVLCRVIHRSCIWVLAWHSTTHLACNWGCIRDCNNLQGRPKRGKSSHGLTVALIHITCHRAPLSPSPCPRGCVARSDCGCPVRLCRRGSK